MGQSDHLRLRKRLGGDVLVPAWPAGIRPIAFSDADPNEVHRLLNAAFPGLVAPFEQWHGNLTTDSEYDPDLCIPALAEDGTIVGFIQCWTSDFIKDLAVSPTQQRKGLGTALMHQAFAVFSARGADHVDLKVMVDEAPARRLYERLGMVEVLS